jgi:hypothetical protein
VLPVGDVFVLLPDGVLDGDVLVLFVGDVLDVVVPELLTGNVSDGSVAGFPPHDAHSVIMLNMLSTSNSVNIFFISLPPVIYHVLALGLAICHPAPNNQYCRNNTGRTAAYILPQYIAISVFLQRRPCTTENYNIVLSITKQL